MSYAGINRGLRGLMFFAHRDLARSPELAGEVALVCHEAQVFNDYLAAGEHRFGLPVSDENVDATAFLHGGSVLVSALHVQDHYHRWVDAGVVENVTITVPWEGRPPRAVHVDVPNVVECDVRPAEAEGAVEVTIPRLELAGFVLVSADEGELSRVRAEVAEARTAWDLVWRTGFWEKYRHPVGYMDVMRINDRAADALAAGEYAETVALWRDALQASRENVDALMRFALARERAVPVDERRFLQVPWSLPNIPQLAMAPGPDEPWVFVPAWRHAGPFPLHGLGGESADDVPAGFTDAYPPEREHDPSYVFETLDGPALWRDVTATAGGMVDIRQLYDHTDGVVSYFRATVRAPEAMETELSLGSNDGARVWVNGELVFSGNFARGADPHQDDFPINLREGRNSVLVKVTQFGRRWKLYLSIEDVDKELEYRAE